MIEIYIEMKFDYRAIDTQKIRVRSYKVDKEMLHKKWGARLYCKH